MSWRRPHPIVQYPTYCKTIYQYCYIECEHLLRSHWTWRNLMDHASYMDRFNASVNMRGITVLFYTFIVFDYVFTYISMPRKRIILYFHLPCFHGSNSVLFYTVLSFIIDIVLTLSLVWYVSSIFIDFCNNTASQHIPTPTYWHHQIQPLCNSTSLESTI